jgi:hypothetical protein
VKSMTVLHFPNPRNRAAHRSDGPGDPKTTQLAGGLYIVECRPGRGG